MTRLKEEKSSIEVAISSLQLEKRRIEKQQTMLQSYGESITDTHKSNAAVQLGQLLQKETIDDMMSFVDRFGEESFSIMEKLHSIDKEVKEQQEKIKMVSYISIAFCNSRVFIVPLVLYAVMSWVFFLCTLYNNYKALPLLVSTVKFIFKSKKFLYSWGEPERAPH